MQKYQDSISVNTNGRLQAFGNATITIQNISGGSSQMYSDNGITPIASTTTDGNGKYSFYANDGRYTLTVSGPAIVTQTITDVLIYDSFADNPPNTSLAAPSGSSLVGYLPAGIGGVATTVQDELRQYVSIVDFAAGTTYAAKLATLATDAGPAFTAAILEIMGSQGAINSQGGEIYVPRKVKCVLVTNPFGVLPNDGAALPSQASLRIFGAGGGAMASGTFQTNGASQIDFQYTTTNNAKIDTRGRGRVELDHLTLMDSSGHNNPFVFTSNSVVLFHDNEVFGSKSGTACDQDVIIFGSTTTNTDGSATAAFQGYGSQVYNNHYHKIRRVALAQNYANGIPIYHNTVWNDCGSNLANGAAIEYIGNAGGTGQIISGCPAHHNLIEMVNYVYGVKGTSVQTSTFGPNDFYDATALTVAYYDFETNSKFNQVIDGMRTDTYPLVREAGTAAGQNSWMTSHQNQPSRMAIGSLQVLSAPGIQNIGTSTLMYGEYIYLGPTVSSTYTSTILQPAGGNPSVSTLMNSGASDYYPFVVQSYDNAGHTVDWYALCAATALRIRAPSGADFKLWGDTLWFAGYAGASASYHAGGQFHGKQAMYPASANTNTTQTACGMWAGTGIPNNNYGVAGDFYFRSDGTVGSNVYKNVTGTWTAIL